MQLLAGVHTISIIVYFSITSLLVVLGKKVLFHCPDFSFSPPFLVGLSFTDSSTVVGHTSDFVSLAQGEGWFALLCAGSSGYCNIMDYLQKSNLCYEWHWLHCHAAGLLLLRIHPP
jgi:hypothetical protein